jgi:hypothetical protein
MLLFYGISNFIFDGEQKDWMKPNNHNHLRLSRIMKFLQYEYSFHKIIFSKSENGEFGSDIFKIGSDVKGYILHRLHDLSFE